MNGLFVDFDMKREKWSEFVKELENTKKYHVYYTRHGDEGDWCTPISVKDKIVFVNRCGWFITDEPLNFDESYGTRSKEIDVGFVLEQLEENIGNDYELDEITNINVGCVDDVDKLFKGGREREEVLGR